jgi:hypothetical protein
MTPAGIVSRKRVGPDVSALIESDPRAVVVAAQANNRSKRFEADVVDVAMNQNALV